MRKAKRGYPFSGVRMLLKRILLRSYYLYSDKQEYKYVELASQQVSISKEERRLLVCV